MATKTTKKTKKAKSTKSASKAKPTVARTSLEQITVRMEGAMLERMDRVAEHMSKSIGTRVVRTDAIRAAVTKGCELMEKEFGLKKGGK